MGFDNRVFNVNGESKETLEKAISLAFDLNSSNTKASHWIFLKDKGLVLLWTERPNSHKLPVPLSADQAANMAWDWLKSEDAKTVTSDWHWDGDEDHDGHNDDGWRVYVEDYGHVGHVGYGPICAIRPNKVWYGK